MNRKIGKIRDVAKETGLSIATISRVMNGAKNVSPETQERVLDACRRLDYLPNPAARALSTNKSRTIAAIIPTIEHSVFAKYIAAIEQTLSERGYSLVLAISNAKEDLELSAARKLLGMGAEAFILSGSAHSPELTGLFERRGVPCVFTSIWDPHSEVPTIGYDNFMLASEAVDFLADKGHRNIAVIHGPLDESDRTRARRAGAAAAVNAAGTGGMALRFFETTLDVAGGKAAIREALGVFGNCTAALCFSDVLALGVYFGLTEHGVRIPRGVFRDGFRQPRLVRHGRSIPDDDRSSRPGHGNQCRQSTDGVTGNRRTRRAHGTGWTGCRTEFGFQDQIARTHAPRILQPALACLATWIAQRQRVRLTARLRSR